MQVILAFTSGQDVHRAISNILRFSLEKKNVFDIMFVPLN